MAATALLRDGPLAGDLVPVELSDGPLPPPFLMLASPVLDERSERFSWAEARYARSPVYKTRYDPAVPWAYFWWDRPLTSRRPAEAQH